jgi:hypothetical protein
MIPLRNQKGQAMVEAAGSLWILFLLFVCIYYLFLMSIDKIRSLDTVYHLARAHQVKKDSLISTTSVMTLCFGRPGRRQINPLTPVEGLAMNEVSFQFLPHSPSSVTLPWKSVMRVVSPKLYFLDKSWPGARTDTFSSVDLLGEQLWVKAQRAVDHDKAADAAEEALDTLNAERG